MTVVKGRVGSGPTGSRDRPIEQHAQTGLSCVVESDAGHVDVQDPCGADWGRRSLQPYASILGLRMLEVVGWQACMAVGWQGRRLRRLSVPSLSF
jgi:hypothetical protein